MRRLRRRGLITKKEALHGWLRNVDPTRSPCALDGLPVLSGVDLRGDEQLEVDLASHAGRCACQFCENVRPFLKDDEGRDADLRPSWEALDSVPELEGRALAAVAELTDDDWSREPGGPRALQDLMDGLASRGFAPSRALVVGALHLRARA